LTLPLQKIAAITLSFSMPCFLFPHFFTLEKITILFAAHEKRKLAGVRRGAILRAFLVPRKSAELFASNDFSVRANSQLEWN
jgi:hypothetical protein